MKPHLKAAFQAVRSADEQERGEAESRLIEAVAGELNDCPANDMRLFLYLGSTLTLPHHRAWFRMTKGMAEDVPSVARLEFVKAAAYYRDCGCAVHEAMALRHIATEYAAEKRWQEALLLAGRIKSIPLKALAEPDMALVDACRYLAAAEVLHVLVHEMSDAGQSILDAYGAGLESADKAIQWHEAVAQARAHLTKASTSEHLVVYHELHFSIDYLEANHLGNLIGDQTRKLSLLRSALEHAECGDFLLNGDRGELQNRISQLGGQIESHKTPSGHYQSTSGKRGFRVVLTSSRLGQHREDT